MAASKNKKWIFIGLGILVVLVVLVMVVSRQEKGIKVSSSKTSLQDITETVSANGTIQPEIEVKISSEVSGEIVELLVKEGDSVRKGQLLLRINPDISEGNVERANATLENARANLSSTEARLRQARAWFEQVKNTYERNRKLHAQKVIPDADMEASEAEYQNAKGEVEAAQKAVDASRYTVKSLESSLGVERKTLSRTMIYAPMDGIVSKLNVEKGERVVGTMQMTGTELLRIADFSSMELRVDVGESDIIRVSPGDTAYIEVDAFDKKEFIGVVKEVANSAKNSGTTTGTTDQVTNFEVKILLLRSSYDELLKQYPGRVSPFLPGMSGMAEIRTSTVKGVMSVPIEAVTTRMAKDSTSEEEKLQEVVFVISGGKVSKRQVTTGIQDNKNIQVISGLNKDEEVVTGPYSILSRTLADGNEVLVEDRKNLFKKE